MKKSRIYMSFAALTLLIAGVLATKANKKFSGYGGPFYSLKSLTNEIFISDACISTPGNFALATLTKGTLPRNPTLFFNSKTVYGWNGTAFQTVYY